MDKNVEKLINRIRNTADYAVETGGKVVNVVGKKAEKMISATKETWKIFDLNKEVDLAYKEIGKLVYLTHAGH